MEHMAFSLVLLLLMGAWRPVMAQKRVGAPFPNEIGDHWRYAFKGFGAPGDSSFIDVDITGAISLPDGKKAMVWVYHYPNGVDTNYVVTVPGGKEVIIYEASYNYAAPGIMPPEKFRYRFPLEERSSWTLKRASGDTLKVISHMVMQVPAGTYPDTWLLINAPDRSHFVGNFRRKDSIWFVPQVGVIKRKQNEIQLRPALGNGTWELSEYRLKFK